MNGNRLVYSTDSGKICAECQKPKNSCACAELARQKVAGNGDVKLRRETKGRGGKSVVVISGLPLNQDQLKSLLGELKRRCGTGGTSKDGTIEIQGEHIDTLREELKKRGYRVKG